MVEEDTVRRARLRARLPPAEAPIMKVRRFRGTDSPEGAKKRGMLVVCIWRWTLAGYNLKVDTALRWCLVYMACFVNPQTRWQLQQIVLGKSRENKYVPETEKLIGKARTHCQILQQSSSPAGYGCSGASRYSTETMPAGKREARVRQTSTTKGVSSRNKIRR